MAMFSTCCNPVLIEKDIDEEVEQTKYYEMEATYYEMEACMNPVSTLCFRT